METHFLLRFSRMKADFQQFFCYSVLTP